MTVNDLLNKARQAAIDEIRKCPEWQQHEKKIAMIFANHFVKYKNVYLR